MPLRPRPALWSAAFAILLAVIANLAWATAIATTGPWYDASVSLAVYAMACAIPTVLAMVLVTSASRRATSLEASLHRVERRVALLRAKLAPRGDGAPRSPPDSDPEDVDLNTLVGQLTDHGPSALVRVEKQGHDTLIPLAANHASSAGSAATAILRQLAGERIALRGARAQVWATAAGPLGACLLFLAIAGPMLPGSDGFAAAHYQLNTTLVLFLAYGLAPLVAWAVVALGSMGAAVQRHTE